ncbi:MAG: type I restriction-modification system subunit M [Bacteroidaceae bacterium]|nr:type I restriction-modification system subunit M [Bacteroidaceae bacterium]
MAKKENTTSIGFEDAIWRAADKLRGNLNASEYEGVVLGLIFLKYISDKFEAKFKELSEDEYADVEDKDEYEADGVFFVPQDARWSVISQAAHTPQIGKVIDDALEAIERENTKLKGVLPSNYARPELDKRRLGDVVDLFTNIHMLASGDEKDLLGRVYEYCLQKFASMEGKNAGEFYTPSCIVRTIVEILQPYAGRVYDPCCGSGGMFVQSAKFIQNHQKDINNISVYGQEANPSTWKMAHMNVAIRGLEANLGKSYADTFFDDQHPTLKADFIMANPPFNLSDWGADKLEKDARWKYGLPPAGNANFAWMQHMIHHLSPTGRIGLVLANGALSSQTGGEGVIRQKIVEADLVEGIIALPSQLFYSTGIPVSLWFLSRNKQQAGKVLFIDARNMGTMVTRAVRELMPEDITKIASTFEAFRNDTLEDEKGFCAVKTLQDIQAQDFILTPGRYVGIAEQEDDGEPFAEKMQRLTSELSGLFAESHRLEDEIKKQLKTIGFEL